MSCSDTSSRTLHLGSSIGLDHAELCQDQGTQYLLQFLKQKLGRLPAPGVGQHLDDLFVELRRQPGCFKDSAKLPLELCTGKVQSKVHSSMFGATVLAELPDSIKGVARYSKSYVLETRICLIGSCCDYDL